jgi:acyl carrier protein
MERLALIQQVVRQVFDDDGLVVTAATRWSDIPGWDSIACIKLVLVLEEEFGVRFAADEMLSAETVGEVLAAVARHREGAA